MRNHGRKSASSNTKKGPQPIKIKCWPYGFTPPALFAYPQQLEELQQFKWILSIPFLVIFACGTYISSVCNSIPGLFIFWYILALAILFFVISGQWPLAKVLPRHPTAVKFSKRKIEIAWTFERWTTGTQSISWKNVRNVHMIVTPGKPSDFRLCFEGERATLWTLTSQQIASKEQWVEVLQALDKFCPVSVENLDREAFDHFSSLDKLAPNFTTLWLDSLSEPPKRNRLEPLPAGALLDNGRFIIQKQLGVGGQGISYLAKRRAGPSVVIKEYLLPIYVDINARRQALENFQREARVLFSLSHPNIVQLTEFFCEDHRAYLILKHIEGQSLRAFINSNGPLTSIAVIAYGKLLCDLLTYLHKRSPPIVHGDFTPDNLIVQSDGTLQLIDFTIAQQPEDTVTSIVSGKSAYMPPEQYQGRLTSQTDIYALGATLYFLLTGEDPEPLTCLHPIFKRQSIDEDLDKLIAKCTALVEKERYHSATQVEDDLSSLKN